MAHHSIEVRYRFGCAGCPCFDYRVSLDPATLTHRVSPRATPPAWARLEVEQCAACPLSPERDAYCPMALSLVDLVEQCGPIMSYAAVDVVVETPERTVQKRTTAQKAVSSLLGLLMATSDCPHMAFLRPMARFHLPFATREETIFRAASVYLLGQYFLRQRGRPGDLELTQLQDAYGRIQAVNLGMAQRLRWVSEGDVNVNAIVLLDLFAQELPSAIGERLEEIAYLFTSYTGPSGEIAETRKEADPQEP